MRSLKVVLGLAALACSFALSAVPAMAAAPMFSTTKVGNGTDKGGLQVFKTLVGSVECKKLTSTEAITVLETATQKAKVKYSECTALGFPATVSEAEYNFHASGSADNLKTVTIEIPVAKCNFKVPPQNNLKTIKYVNKPGGKIEVQANVTKIKYTTTGGACGKEGKEATYVGNAEVEEAGATLEWEALS